MKLKNVKYIACAAVLGLGLTSCDDFLDRPVEDNYNTENYYSSNEACISGVNYLYNSPWYDFQRGFIKVGEVFAGNMYWGNSPYMNFSVNGTDQDLVNMSYSLWSVIGHSNTVYQSLASASADQKVKDQCMGECLVWKAMAYFYLVRTFGDVPIIHNTSEVLASGEYKTCKKIQKKNVYEYVILTLNKAMELMPKQKRTDGHMDYYCAEALLAKVYLTMAGLSGTLDKTCLTEAASLSDDVIKNSGRNLMANYEDIFRGSNNLCDEILIAWRWTVGSHWTCQNTLQSDLAIVGFSEYGDVWGGWGGPSLDLIEAFGVEPTDDPSDRILKDKDLRRKATCMLAGDQYPYFWRDKTSPSGYVGFDYIEAIFDTETSYGKSFSEGQCQGPCGSNNVKHLFGDEADHKAEMGVSAARMASALCTPLLRLSDVYLINVEAQVLLGNGSSSDCCQRFYDVRHRAVPTYNLESKITFDQVWKERRLEFAGEGDRWYDFVRRSYYDVNSCISELKSQKRNSLWGMNAVYKTWYESDYSVWDISEVEYDKDTAVPNVTANSFTIPFPTEDVVLNPNLGSNAEAVEVNVKETYKY